MMDDSVTTHDFQADQPKPKSLMFFFGIEDKKLAMTSSREAFNVKSGEAQNFWQPWTVSPIW